jgi:nitrate reductase alpha subunit
MSICMPERMLFSSFVASYQTIKASLEDYISDIFDVDIVGQTFIDRATEFLSNNKLTLAYGYPQDDENFPASWHLVLLGSGASGEFVENLMGTEPDPDNDLFVETYAMQKQFQIKLISSSPSAEAVLIMDCVARYILAQIKSDLSSIGLEEVTFSTSELDPILQYLPNSLYHRATTISGKCFDTWTMKIPLLDQIKLVCLANADVFSSVTL